MGFLGSMAKAGVLKRVWDEGRKPKNQKRIKDLVAKVRGGGKSSGKSNGKGGSPPKR